MIYPADQEDENARMDAEQDAKLERAMADREDRVYIQIRPRNIGRTQALINVIKEHLEEYGCANIMTMDVGSQVFEGIMYSLRNAGLQVKATTLTKKIMKPIYELYPLEPMIVGYREEVLFCGWKIEMDDNDDLPF